jgi:hypothetical protein
MKRQLFLEDKPLHRFAWPVLQHASQKQPQLCFAVGKFVPALHYAPCQEDEWRNAGTAPPFVTSAPDGCERPASCSSCFIPEGTAPEPAWTLLTTEKHTIPVGNRTMIPRSSSLQRSRDMLREFSTRIHKNCRGLSDDFIYSSPKPRQALGATDYSTSWWLSSSGRWRRVALIRNDVSEDRIASIFRVYEYSFHRSRCLNKSLPLALCLLVLVHPEDGGDTILRNVSSYNSHTASSPRRW